MHFYVRKCNTASKMGVVFRPSTRHVILGRCQLKEMCFFSIRYFVECIWNIFTNRNLPQHGWSSLLTSIEKNWLKKYNSKNTRTTGRHNVVWRECTPVLSISPTLKQPCIWSVWTDLLIWFHYNTYLLIHRQQNFFYKLK